MELKSKIEREQNLADRVIAIQTEFSKITERKKATDYIRKHCLTVERQVTRELGLFVDKNTGIAKLKSLSPDYYLKILRDYRRVVKTIGYKHHALETNLSRIIKRYSNDVDTELLRHDLPIEQLRDNVKILSSQFKGSKIGNDLSSLKVEHQAYYNLYPHPYIVQLAKKESEKKLEESLSDQLTVNPSLVIKKIESMLESNDEKHLITGLAMATGRRLSEITYRAQFVKIDEHHLSFTGQLKTKNRALFESVDAVKIPTLVSSKKVINALKKLRKSQRNLTISYEKITTEGKVETVEIAHHKAIKNNLFDVDTMDAIVQKYSKQMNQYIKTVFAGAPFKITRAIYASIAYKDHAYKGESFEAFKKRVFNHSDIQTQVHYSKVLVDNELKTLCTKPKIERPEKGEVDNELLNLLSEWDHTIYANKRSPNAAKIHNWMKEDRKSVV